MEETTMTTSFKLAADDLDLGFIEKLKSLFAHKNIEIVIYEQDETDYLMSDPENRRQLLASVEDVRNKRNMVTIDPEIFEDEDKLIEVLAKRRTVSSIP